MSRRAGGAIAVMFAGALFVICGFMGLALDLSMAYNRKMEMQNLANTVALAAATELNGTTAGVNAALLRASERFIVLPGTVVGGMSYQYSTKTMTWSSDAIEFGATPTGPWVDAATAQAQPLQMLFAKVDTSALDPAYGEVATSFIQVLLPSAAVVSLTGRAVAGRSAIKVVPMGICAMRPEAARAHAGELEEYGFRRGVSYDLMQLNPDGTGAGKHFLINPFVAPGTPGIAAAPSAESVSPFICTGTMAMSKVTGGDVVVKASFPLDALFASFNSRFESYTPPCRRETAPPDTNIKAYIYNNGSVPWMDAVPSGQSAAPSLADGKRWTVVGPDITPVGTTAGMYGPLWSYAKAAKFSSYVAGAPEPLAGYSTFGTSDWATLYNPGQPKPKSYPATVPYLQTSATYSSKSTGIGVRGRRVLNIPLLACPVSGDRATIRAIGKFFMTVPAKSDLLIGEFAGVASEQSLGTRVRLYP
jgi:Flp pilus assembly protein TadG